MAVKSDLLETLEWRIQRAMERGATSLWELYRLTGFTASNFHNLCDEAGIDVPEFAPRRTRPELDEGINAGLSLPEIGKQAGISSEAVRLYIARSGQYLDHRRNRAAAEDSTRHQRQLKKQLLSRLSTALNAPLERLLIALHSRMLDLEPELRWAHAKALNYRALHPSKRPNSYSFTDLVLFYREYNQARQSGQKKSLEELGKGIGILAPSAGYLLKAVGLEPLYSKCERRVLSDWEKDALVRAFYTELPATDIAYFLEVGDHVVLRHFSGKGKRTGQRQIGLPRRERLLYRLASQIYAAESRGLSPDEISDVLNVTVQKINHVFEHRGEIEQVLLRSLRHIFDDPTISKPYVAKDGIV